MTRRIDELETRLALQDESILQMSDELYKQQQKIAELTLQVRHLTERVRTLAAQAPSPPPEEETPPHY
jgi:SlyX protein